jgi:hypothetical protein
MADELVAFIEARLAEAEQTAGAVHMDDCSAVARYIDGDDRLAPCGPCDCGFPARMLREVEAKRRILALHPLTTYTDEEPGYSQTLNDHLCPGRQTPCTTLRLLALPYDQHADYRADWGPSAGESGG